jgi:protein disulfide-isomerase
MSMTRVALIALAFVSITAAAFAEDAVHWAGDYRQAAEQAARERKLVLLHFESDDCAPCKRLAANVFSRRDVAEAMAANFVPVKVNVSRTPELARRYGVASWPQDVVVTPMGQEVYRQVSQQDPNEYIAKLKETAARAGSSMARSNSTQPGSSAGVTASQANPRGKAAAPDLSSEFQSPTIENGSATEPKPAMPQQNEYVARPQMNPYSPQGVAENHAARSSPAADEGSDYQGLEATPARSAAEPAAKPESPAIARPQPNEYVSQPPRQSAPVAAPPAAENKENKAPVLPPIGMEGYCVVTLAEKGAWAKGDKHFGAIHRGRLYLFASTEAQKTFLADPDRFAPALSGYDPVVFRETEKLVDGKRAIGLTYNGQVYVFSSEESLRKFESSPKPFADTVYQAMLRSDQASKLR